MYIRRAASVLRRVMTHHYSLCRGIEHTHTRSPPLPLLYRKIILQKLLGIQEEGGAIASIIDNDSLESKRGLFTYRMLLHP